SRLCHSDLGYVRAMQMSTSTLWVFVEGKVDRYFYGRLVARECHPRGVRYRVVAAEELPGAEGGGGKRRLLAYFGFLRTRREPVSWLASKLTVTLFFVDKDIDDLRRRRKRSLHFVYTKYYDVENHIFEAGNIAEGLAAALLIDEVLAGDVVGDPYTWRRRAASRWREWMALCILAMQIGASTDCNYGVRSRVNRNEIGSLDPAALAKRKTTMATAAGMTGRELDHIYQLVLRRIDSLLLR